MAAQSRWHEAFVLACEGCTNKQIAARMGVTEQTVKNHLLIAYRQMSLIEPGIGDRNPRTYFAYRAGWRDCASRLGQQTPAMRRDEV